MTQQNMVIDGANGRVAVYSGPQSDAIEADPTTDLSKVTFHSDLDYIGFKRVRKTHTIAATSGSAFNMVRVDLGAHGKAFTPITFAILRGWINGDGTAVDIPLGGGVLLDFYGERPDDTGLMDYEAATGHTDKWSRSTLTFFRATNFDNSWQQKSLLVGAGANDTDLFLWYEQTVRVFSDSASYPAFALTIDFYVGDRSIDGSSGDAAPSDLFFSDAGETIIESTRLTVSGSTTGVFDTANGYFHRDDVSPDLSVAVSDAVLLNSTRTHIDYGPNWTYTLTDADVTADPIPTITRVGVAF